MLVRFGHSEILFRASGSVAAFGFAVDAQERAIYFGQTDETQLQTLVGLLVVLLTSAVLSMVATTVFAKGLPAAATALAITGSIVTGYLMASVFFHWQPLDSSVKRRLVFPGVVSVLSVISAFVGLGPIFGWAFATSLIPAHAGMSGWLLGIVASTLVVAFVSRLVDGFIANKLRFVVPKLENDALPLTASASGGGSWEVLVTRGAGVILLLLLMVCQGVAGPLILRRFGPDASYDTAVSSTVRSIVFMAPFATLVGFALERVTRGHASRRRWIALFLILMALLAVGEVSYRFTEARGSEAGRWWIEHWR